MKTAMEELIEYVKETWGWYEDFEIVSDKLLEKEKEQIIDAFNEGIDEMAFDTSGINYYNRNYGE